jgi:hypothetical protein
MKAKYPVCQREVAAAKSRFGDVVIKTHKAKTWETMHGKRARTTSSISPHYEQDQLDWEMLQSEPNCAGSGLPAATN